MTAICGGGTSSPQAGVGGVLTIGAAAIEVFISTVLALPEMAPVLAPIIAGLVDISIASYCGTDPPADPGLTANIVADAISIPPSFTTFESQQKVLQWFESRYWYQVCQCNSVTTPTPPTPSNPGPVSSNSGLPVQQQSPCWNVTLPYSVPARLSGGPSRTDFSPAGLPPGPITPTTILSTGPVVAQAVTLPTGIKNIGFKATMNEPIHNTTGGTLIAYFMDFFSGSEYLPDELNVLFQTGTTVSSTSILTLPLFNCDTCPHAVFVQNGDDVAHSGTISVNFFCGPNTPAPSACCPPDPLLEGELQQILQYVQAIYAGLPVPPNSFAEGTVHSGLTGNGSITFSGVPIALKITLTTIPPALGFDVGSPDFYFDVGYLSFATSEGNYAQQRLTLQEQVVQVPLLSGSAGYTLRNGVVATITELLPGP